MFVTTERFRRNPKSNIYYKKLPKVFYLRGCSLNRKAVSPILDCSVNPKGSFAYKFIFDMTEENNFVTQDMVYVQVTPAQHKLLQLLQHREAEDYFTSLKHIHYLGTYCVDKDMLDLNQNGYVHNLLDAIQEIKQEHFINSLKTA